MPFVLAACSTGGSSPAAQDSPPVSVETNHSAGSADDPLDNGGHAEYTWEDFVQIEREMSGLTTWPEVDRIRFVSQEDWPTEQAHCLSAQGFPTTVQNDGFTTNGVTEQQEAFDEASYICRLQYPMDLKYAQAFSRTQLRTIYDYYRDSLIPCLQDMGFEAAPLPSEETYVEGVASGTSNWSPYDAINLGAANTQKLHETCPAMPSEDVLYGG